MHVWKSSSLLLQTTARQLFARIHKALHEEGKQREHIYEKLGQKLTAQRLAKIVENSLVKN